MCVCKRNRVGERTRARTFWQSVNLHANLYPLLSSGESVMVLIVVPPVPSPTSYIGRSCRQIVWLHKLYCRFSDFQTLIIFRTIFPRTNRIFNVERPPLNKQQQKLANVYTKTHPQRAKSQSNRPANHNHMHKFDGESSSISMFPKHYYLYSTESMKLFLLDVYLVSIDVNQSCTETFITYAFRLSADQRVVWQHTSIRV